MPQHRERGRGNGFTLLELLVALVVFALAFGAMAEIIQTGLRQSTVAQSRAAATLLARSVLARVGIDLPLAVGRANGETEDGMHWHTETELVEGPSEHQNFAIYQVQVSVAWGGSPAQHATLTTLRVGPPQ